MNRAQQQSIRDTLSALGDALIAALDEPVAFDGTERLMSVEAAAERLSLARSTVWAAIAAGRIKSVRPVGTKRRLIAASEVDRIARGDPAQ